MGSIRYRAAGYLEMEDPIMPPVALTRTDSDIETDRDLNVQFLAANHGCLSPPGLEDGLCTIQKKGAVFGGFHQR